MGFEQSESQQMYMKKGIHPEPNSVRTRTLKILGNIHLDKGQIFFSESEFSSNNFCAYKVARKQFLWYDQRSDWVACFVPHETWLKHTLQPHCE